MMMFKRALLTLALIGMPSISLAQQACPTGDALIDKDSKDLSVRAARSILAWQEVGKSGMTEGKHIYPLMSIMSCYWSGDCGMADNEPLGNAIRLSIKDSFPKFGLPAQPPEDIPSDLSERPPQSALNWAVNTLNCTMEGATTDESLKDGRRNSNYDKGLAAIEEKDWDRAVDLLGKACKEQHYYKACGPALRIHADGRALSDLQSYWFTSSRLGPLGEGACKVGDLDACRHFVNLADRDPEPYDYARVHSMQYRTWACNHDEALCGEVRDAILDLNYPTYNVPIYAELVAEPCDENQSRTADFCTAAGLLLGYDSAKIRRKVIEKVNRQQATEDDEVEYKAAQNRADQALSYTAQACEMGSDRGCLEYKAVRLAMVRGSIDEMDADMADMKARCDGGSSRACDVVAMTFDSHPRHENPLSARQYRRKSYDLRKEACTENCDAIPVPTEGLTIPFFFGNW